MRQYSEHSDLSDHSRSQSFSSLPSSISNPSHSWASAVGTTPGRDAALAAEYQGRSCHLCFNPNHFLMDCPLLGKDIRQVAQRQRDQQVNESRKGNFPGSRFPMRPQLTHRPPEPRSPPRVVTPVVPDAQTRTTPPSPTWSEN